MKYVDAKVVFQEIPDEITLAISISGCTIHCAGCHSKYLWDDVGELLTIDSLKQLIEKNSGITCVCFMGGDSNPLLISQFAFDLFLIGFSGYFTKVDIGILIIFFCLSFMKNMFLADSIFKERCCS